MSSVPKETRSDAVRRGTLGAADGRAATESAWGPGGSRESSRRRQRSSKRCGGRRVARRTCGPDSERRGSPGRPEGQSELQPRVVFESPTSNGGAEGAGGGGVLYF